ncbi:MAG: hypothetical protein AAFX02_04820 [Pseudomonadota bacterium]
MIHPSTRKLIDRLSEMTLLDRVAWAEGENGAIVFDSNDYRILLSADPKQLTLTDALGKELEFVTSEQLSETANDEGENYAALIDTMYVEGLRIAKGTKLAIDRIMASLDTLGAEIAQAAE